MAKLVTLKPQDARSLAIMVLQELSVQNSIQSTLDYVLTKFPLDPLDINLSTELVYGYTRYSFRINYILDTLLKKRTKLPRALQLALGISIYSLLFLTRVPHYATVSWAVNFTKKHYGVKLSNLCNAVLRAFIRLENEPLNINFYKEAHLYYSCPKWIFDLWLNSYGQEITTFLLERSLNRPHAAIRLNKLHEKYNILHSFFSNFNDAKSFGFDGFMFSNSNLPKQICNFNLNELHDEGAFSWQSAGSQISLYECFANVPELYNQSFWDACAGQGGKTFALLEQGINVTLASDVSNARIEQFKFTAQRLNIEFSNILPMDVTNPNFDNFNGSILLDVPCTGLGTLCKRPDIKLNRSLEDAEEISKLQKNILQKAWSLLSINSYLIYITCTLNPHENENQVKWFLKNHPNAIQVFSWQTPHTHLTLEGMFAAVLKKVK